MVAGSKIAKALEREGGSFPLLSYLKRGQEHGYIYFTANINVLADSLRHYNFVVCHHESAGDLMSLMMDPTISQADRAKFIENTG